MENMFRFNPLSLVLVLLITVVLFTFFEPLSWGKTELINLTVGCMTVCAIGVLANQMFRRV